MHENKQSLRDVSDTARWVAVYRARENDRPDALFRDPFARRLGGERGEEIARSMQRQDRHAWAFNTRTWVFDAIIHEAIANGVDMVINLAAGLDSRPYRLSLPQSLQWIEVDLPPLVAYKEEILRDERPHCALQRAALDLSDREARRTLFTRLGTTATNALIVTEGLLIYLAPEDVRTLADDLAAQASFRRWIFDLASPALVAMMLKEFGKTLEKANAPFQFAPANGPEFFATSGWQLLDVHSNLKTAAKLNRLPFLLRLFAMLPEGKPPWSRLWGGTCVVGR